MNYYNEIDKSAANWIRQLIKDGLIPPGDVDERSIVDVKPEELKSYAQCHFFAGIAGWSYALQLAGWPSDRPVWTGSCPCQPFSTAGKGLGQSDERHLWPAFFNLIRECRPQQVFGEQVASAIGHGWLDGISSDLESEGYACGATVLGAHSVGAPHIRKRLYWVANTNVGGQSGPWVLGRSGNPAPCENWEINRAVDDGRCCWMVNSDSDGRESRGVASTTAGHRNSIDAAGGGTGRMGNPDGQQTDSTESGQSLSSAGLLRCWDSSRLVQCRDGKARRIPTEPSFFPLAHGIPARMVRLRGYGNAIVPQVAAEFVMAFMEVEQMDQKNTIQ